MQELNLNFATDYMYGALPEVMEALQKTNMVATVGYGNDSFCNEGREMIRSVCKAPDAEIWFTTGGTQTNTSVIDSLLRPGQGVLAAESSHINVHESGAVEAFGHKVITLPQNEGKISPRDIEKYLKDFYADETWPHMVEPGMVYISFPTELGALYSREELREIHEVCRRYGKPLYIDGARLGYGLAASPDITLEDMYSLCDVFYIGGTKQGLLMGEAVVAHPGLLYRFFTQTKRHGGLLAKGRILGVQFMAIFSDDLYMKSSRRAVNLALELRKGFSEAGIKAIAASPTNQQFFRLPNDLIDYLSPMVSFEIWGSRGKDSSEVRFVTSWATTSEEVNHLLKLVSTYLSR